MAQTYLGVESYDAADRSLLEAYHDLGLAYDRMGRPDDTIQTFRDAAGVRPTYAAA